MNSFPLARVCLVLAVILAAGCGDARRARVRGKVTLDGKPLSEGRIGFFPTDATAGPMSGAVITDGAYQIPAANGVWVGNSRVEINASLFTGRKVMNPSRTHLVDEKAEAIPPRFNSKSQLVREIKPGDNELDFELSSK